MIEEKDYKSRIEAYLPKALQVPGSMPQTLLEAMTYSLMAGGKRVRPVLTLAVADMLEDKASSKAEVLDLAAAVEMIHTYSLIHDDLPAMDNDVLRRGKATNHVVFGEAMAILAGDALLTRAFELMGRHYDEANYPAGQKLRAWAVLSRCAGASGMVGGQVLDIESEKNESTLDEIIELQTLKTARLIQAGIVGVAELLGASDKVIGSLKDFGLYLGQAFQIQDDILDVVAEESQLGKSTGKDQDHNKGTFVTLLGLNGAKEKLTQVWQQLDLSLEQLRGEGLETDFLEAYVDLLRQRTY